jgi:hypothetical protein
MTITTSWLRALGVDVPEEDLPALANHAEAALELRVGTSIVETLTEDELQEFEGLIEQGASEAERLQWLEENAPEYKRTVRKRQ